MKLLLKLKQIIISWLYDQFENEKLKRATVAALAKKEVFEAQQRANAARTVEFKKKRQDACTHLKGGRALRGPSADYAIWIHTFSDETKTIRCLICSKEWPESQWKTPEVEHMLAHTTNTQTASEINYSKKDRKEPLAIAAQEDYPPVLVESQIMNGIWNLWKKKRGNNGPNRLPQ